LPNFYDDLILSFLHFGQIILEHHKPQMLCNLLLRWEAIKEEKEEESKSFSLLLQHHREIKKITYFTISI